VGDKAYTESEYVKDTPVDERPRSYEDQRNLDRRLSAFKHYTWGKDIADFGCGAGLFLDAVIENCSSVVGIELQTRFLDSMKNRGVPCTNSLDSIPDSSLDCIFSFHVLEHLPDPIETLKTLKKKLRPGGLLIVEVPHARDILLSGPVASKEFKRFTLWSQHLILHTRDSLRALLLHTGFESILIKGIQRYPLSNHLFWLAHNKPGGHVSTLSELDSDELYDAYVASLARIDRTDTLIGIVQKPL
jgi:2-polyprenyl-3-methyl-5-hydroxy-6-metoxy-1,4-benzoquinol methylase